MIKPYYKDYPFGISIIDSNYYRQRLAGSYLLVEEEEAAFIEVGTSLSTPVLLDVLDKKGILRKNVRYVFVSHVHLDHAGGAGNLLRYLPNARLVVHPRGARHMIDPTKLIAGATAVYGESEMERLYGTIYPITSDRVLEGEEGSEFFLKNRVLRIMDTPGHALHHFCVWDERSKGLFTGDTFGISYREFDTKHGEFIFPTSTPVQFDPQAMHHSIDRLMELQPETIYFTHFGAVKNNRALVQELHRKIDQYVEIAESARSLSQNRHQKIREELQETFWKDLLHHGVDMEKKQALEILAMDLDLNAQGLSIWLDKKK